MQLNVFLNQQAKKIKKKIFKKKLHFLTTYKHFFLKILKLKKPNARIYNVFLQYTNAKHPTRDLEIKKDKNLIVQLNQKSNNTKVNVLVNNLCKNTFSIGSITKFFKIQQGKFIRRSKKGTKIILNFTKTFLLKKFNTAVNYFSLNISGFDYNLYSNKKLLRFFFFKNTKRIFLLNNICISFTKIKLKKIKSIKKRLKKKILINFLKNFNR